MDLWMFLLIVLVGGVCIAIGLQLRPLGAGPREIEAAAHMLEDALSRANDLVAAMRALTRELEKTGAEVAGQSTERLQALKTAVEDADNRIDRLTSAPEASPAATAPVTAAAADPPARGGRLDLTVHDEGAEPSDGQGRMAERYEAMYRLADQGHTVEEIAQHMQLGKGEVELILSLRHPR